MKAVLLLAGLLACAVPGLAMAQTCIGIETRVIAQTLGLDAAVGSQIGATQGAMLGLEQLQAQRLVSALRVMTKQQSGSTDQLVVTEQQAGQAAAAAYGAQQQAYAVASAKDRYGATGFGACAVGVKASSFYGAVTNAPTARAAIAKRSPWQPNSYGTAQAWVNGPAAKGPFDASALFGGTEAQAGDYIGLIMGPPDSDPGMAPTASAEAGSMRIDKANRDALKSTAQTVLASVAADFAPDGPVAKMREMSDHWLAKDGGEAWAANMAAAPERGILQDAVRVEAANLASLAFSLKSNTRQEAAAAALLLSRINNAAGEQ